MSFFPVSVPTQLELLIAKNNTKVTLDGGINDVITTIPVLDTSDIPDSGYLTFEDGTNEVIHYTGKTLTTLTGVTRGADGTAPSSHGDGTGIGMWDNSEYHNILSGEIRGICQNLSDRMGLHATRIILQDYLDANSKKISGLAAGTVAGDALRYEQLVGVYLPLAGGTMVGNIAMGGTYKLTGLAAGSGAGDSVRYEQVLLLSGGTMAGNIAMGTNKLTGLGAGSVAGDSVRYEQVMLLAGATMTGAMGISVGTDLLPGLFFSGDPDTGIYQGAGNPNFVGIAIGGVAKVQVESAWVTVGNPLRIVDGNVSTPAVIFNADADTGMYRIGDGSIGFSSNGTLIATINASGLTVNSGVLSATVQFGDGSVSAPSITFASDPDTGIYRYGTNQLGLATNATLGLFIDSDQKIGMGNIGTAGYKLSLKTEDATNGTAIILHGNTVSGSSSNITLRALTLAGPVRMGYLEVTGAPIIEVNAGASTQIGVKIQSYNTGTVTALDIPYTGEVLFRSGSTSNPSIAFIGDTDTGMYRASANTVGVSCGGVASILIDNPPDIGSTETTLRVYVKTLDALRNLVVGAADSGGTGFRMVRIPNT